MMVIFDGHSFEEGMDIGALVMLFHSPLGSYPPSQSRETITLSASPTPLCICTFLLQCKFRTIDNGQFISRKTPSNSRCELQHGFVYRLYHYYCLQSTSPQVFTSQYTKMGRGRGICSRCILYFVFGLWGGGGLVHLLRNIWPILDRGTQLICFECLLNTLWSTTLLSRMVKVDNTMSRVSSIFGQGEKTNIRRHLNICPTHV